MIAREQRKLIKNNLHAPPNLFQAIFGRLKNAFLSFSIVRVLIFFSRFFTFLFLHFIYVVQFSGYQTRIRSKINSGQEENDDFEKTSDLKMTVCYYLSTSNAKVK